MVIPLVELKYMDLIRGFVAVGRRMSITQAAEDLCLTQSAVSRQIRSLEEKLGVKLFNRGHRLLTFTPEGQRFFNIANSAVQQLQDGVEAIAADQSRNVVRISASIGVAGLWLLPRLGELQKKHPDVEVRIVADNTLIDLQSTNANLAIRYCPETEVGSSAIRLFGETLAPVAHPSLEVSTFDNKEALHGQVLLEFDDVNTPWLQWAYWLQTRGWTDCQFAGILSFNQYDQVVQAATEGQGIALGRLELVQSMITDNRLRALSTPEQSIVTDHAFWLIRSTSNPRSEVEKTASWIVEQSHLTAP